MPMGGKVAFQMGSFIFKWGEWCSMGDISFDGRFFKKYCRMGASGPHAPTSVLNKNKSAID